MITPSKVQAAALRLENENLRFRAFLKTHADEDELDRQFLTLHNKLFAQYDCCKCGNCCREYSTDIADDEIDTIAAFLRMTRQDFIVRYLKESPGGYELSSPCPLLQNDGTCQIQACKPLVCRSFPHTDKPERLESLLSILSFAEVCPVVFELLQRLKDIYHFPR